MTTNLDERIRYTLYTEDYPVGELVDWSNGWDITHFISVVLLEQPSNGSRNNKTILLLDLNRLSIIGSGLVPWYSESLKFCSMGEVFYQGTVTKPNSTDKGNDIWGSLPLSALLPKWNTITSPTPYDVFIHKFIHLASLYVQLDKTLSSNPVLNHIDGYSTYTSDIKAITANLKTSIHSMVGVYPPEFMRTMPNNL